MKRISSLLLVFITVFSILSCENEIEKEKIESPLKLSKEYVNYVSAYTSGVINRNSPIKFIFNKAVEYPYEVGKELPGDVFSITPKVDGLIMLEDQYTLVFRPDKPLSSSTVFNGHVNLKKLLKAGSELEKFPFKIQTLKQNAKLENVLYKFYNDENVSNIFVEAELNSADYISEEGLEEVIKAEQEGKGLPIKFIRKSNTEIKVVIDSVRRSDNSSYVVIDFDGEKLGLKNTDTYKINIPSIDDFEVLEVKNDNSSKSHIQVIFSSPLSRKKDLKGMFAVFNTSDRFLRFNTVIESNILKIYPNDTKDLKSVVVYKGIEDVNGVKIKKEYRVNIEKAQITPSLKMLGKGSIMPDSEGLIFPFEAKGLKNIRVRITKVYNNNLGQFLQDNELSTSYSSLRKVGRPVYNSDVPLNIERDTDYKLSKRYYIDIEKLIDVEKGTVYNVELSFKQANLAFPCDGQNNNDGLKSLEENPDYWDGEGYDNNYYDYDYDYSERYNPCHSYFYRYNDIKTKISKNLVASNFGIIAKKSEDGRYNIVVSDLRTTESVSGAKVEMYNYQGQLMQSSTTNEDGFSTLFSRKKGFYIKAEKEENIGFLKLNEGNALSYSMFDIGGKTSPRGIKGFIYGERGVWRPGDSIHVFFVLEDKIRKIPNEYPVTFELFNPDRQLIKREVVQKGKNGFYKFTPQTSPDDITGKWTVVAKAGDQTFNKTLRIEMVKPNRLKVELSSDSDILQSSFSNKLKLSSKWLTGASAAGLKATVKVKLLPVKTSFKDYIGYNFDDPSKSFYSDEEEILNSKLDANGDKKFTYFNQRNKEMPGMMKARFTSNVFEKGGDYSVNTQDYLLSNFKSYVGMNIALDEENYNMIHTGKEKVINLVSVDKNGKKVNSNLQVNIYKLRWSWWWSRSNNDIANYIKNTDYISKKSGLIKTVNGKASFKFTVDSKDWGRYYIKVTDKNSGHTSGKEIYIDWPNWNSRGNSNPDAATMLTFNSEKSSYTVGEDVKLIIPTADKGRALISLEKGGKVLKLFWAETKKGVTEVSFKATEDMSPNVYANITFIQKHSQTVNDMPIRMYGASPITIVDENTHLNPQLETPESIESESKYQINVSEKDAKAMTYSLAVVDEGLLDLTNHKTPELWDHFYQKEALRTLTWDMYDLVMGAYGAKLEKMFAIGGDSENMKKGKKKADRFKPVVTVLGPFNLEEGEKKEHTLLMSNYVGSVRVMVVAANNGAYGSAEKAVPVKKPVMVLATLPRVLGTTEICELPVSVFAMDKNVKNVKVKVETNDIISIVGDEKAELKFTDTGEKMLFFKVKTSTKTGVAKVKVSVEANSSKAYQEIELDVRNPNPLISVSKQYVMNDGEDLEFEVEPIGVDGSNDLRVEVSAMPGLNLESRLSYLIAYPHGCIEQTTSSVFPQLYLDKLTNLSDLVKAQTEKNIKSGIARLYKFQLEDGGMSYWIGSKYANQWGTSYAGHFMLLAQELGYSLPSTFKEKWLKYQTSKANSWTKSTPNEMVQAYRLYTLALAGKPQIGAMNRLKEMDLRIEAREMLASAYAISGSDKLAKSILENNEEPKVEPRYSYYYYSYGSRQRDQAVKLLTYVHVKDQNLAFKNLNKIAENLSSDNYMSTQTAAFSLLAVSKYIEEFKPSNSIDIEYSVDGEDQKVNSTMPLFTITGVNNDKKQKVEIENNKQGMLYVNVIRKGIPLINDEHEYSENLSLIVNYTDVNGNKVSVDNLKQGTEFKAWVTVRNTNSIDEIKDVALSQVFPSGWEIVNNRLLGTVDKSADQPTNIDIRDDRVYQYFDLKPSESKTFVVSLIAAYSGEYYLPGVYVEAMYDDTFKAMIKGKIIKVVSSN